MNKKMLVLGVLSALIVSMTGAFALTTVTQNESEDYMDKMHEQMTQNIKDPQLKKQLDDMHEGCEKGMHENKGSMHQVGNGFGMGSMMENRMGK